MQANVYLQQRSNGRENLPGVTMKCEGRVQQTFPVVGGRSSSVPLHESWVAFIRFCEDLQHGEIEKIKIQDGVPVLAELATRKIKFL